MHRNHQCLFIEKQLCNVWPTVRNVFKEDKSKYIFFKIANAYGEKKKTIRIQNGIQVHSDVFSFDGGGEYKIFFYII